MTVIFLIRPYYLRIIARPPDPSVIRYFIRMAEIFSSDGENEERKGDRLVNICDRLHMTEKQLNRLQKANGTKTARSIVRACYPASTRIDVKHEDIDADFRQAIHGKLLFFFYLMLKKCIYFLDYVQLFHGMEGLTEGKINESINNVFRSAKSQQ